MMTRAQGLMYGLGIALLLVVGIGATSYLYRAKEAPPRQERVSVGPLVNVTVAQRQNVELTVEGHGTVRAKMQAQVIPQVSGRVLSVHPNLITGGYVKAGQELVKIDPADYQLALEQAQAAKAAADAELATAKAQIAEARANVNDAEDELDRIRQLQARNAANEREVRKAQVALDVAHARLDLARSAEPAAQSKLANAQVQIEQAKLNLERTSVSVPFDAMVTEESVDVGRFITAGQPIASVYGTDAVEIPVPLEDAELAWFTQVPLAHEIHQKNISKDDLPIADIYARFGGRDCHWIGRVVRSEGTIDPRTRMVRVIVEVEDPLPVLEEGRDEQKPPLIPGAFVNVEIRGRTLDSIFVLPRHAVHAGGKVWVVENGQLHVRQIDIVRRDQADVYVRGAIEEGDLIVTTPLDTVTDRMKVRVPAEFAERAGTAAPDAEAPPAAADGPVEPIAEPTAPVAAEAEASEPAVR